MDSALMYNQDIDQLHELHDRYSYCDGYEVRLHSYGMVISRGKTRVVVKIQRDRGARRVSVKRIGDTCARYYKRWSSVFKRVEKELMTLSEKIGCKAAAA